MEHLQTIPRKANPFGVVWRFFWRGLTTLRRWVLNTVTLLLLVGVVVWWVARMPVALQDNTVLVLDLQGQLVEQTSAKALNITTLALQGGASNTATQVQLRDVITVLDSAAHDPKIARVLLRLDDFHGGGLASMREVAAALQRLRQSGKRVIAWGTSYDQRQYFLAAQADEVLIHPMGMVELDGFGGETQYFKDALERLGIKAHVVRAGSYKSYAETFTENAPSPAALEAEAYVLDALWANYTHDVETARGLPAGKIMQVINTLPETLAAAQGNVSKLLLDAKLVTGVKTFDEVRDDLLKVGAKDTTNEYTFRQVAFSDYLSSITKPSAVGDGVAIVVAEGEIVRGEAPRGAVGSDSTAALIRDARQDDTVKAVVLRVNSPGGEVVASDVIRRELELTRAAGKPVVVSMGDVAASGGYWISTAADKIIAEPTTITGSIGVVTLFPTAEGLMDKLSIHQGGHQTTWLKSAMDLGKPLNPRVESLLQSNINHLYDTFLSRVSTARHLSKEAADAVAQGRIWTGQQALERGLIDQVGSLQTAVDAALTLAKLSKDSPVRYLEAEVKPLDALLGLFGAQAAASITAALPAWVHSPLLHAVQADTAQLQGLLAGDEPFKVMAHCACGVRW
jgi:protease-4